MLKMHVFLCWLSSRVGKPLAKLEYLTKCMHPSVCLHHSFEANKNMFYNKSPIVYPMILLFYFLKAAQIDWQHSLPSLLYEFQRIFSGFFEGTMWHNPRMEWSWCKIEEWDFHTRFLRDLIDESQIDMPISLTTIYNLQNYDNEATIFEAWILPVNNC